MRGGRVAEFVQKILCQGFRLTDVGVVPGFIAAGIVVLLRRDVACLLTDTCEEPLGTVPNRAELTVVQRRHTIGGLFQETLIRRFRIAVFLDDPAGEAGHGRVPASLRDHLRRVPVRQIGVEVVTPEKVRQIHDAVVYLDIRFGGAEEETGCVQGLGIKKRKNRVDQLLQVAVCIGILDRVDREEDVELRPGRGSVLLLHMMAAVVDGKAHTREIRRHILRRHPEGGIIAVVIVAVDREAVRTQVVRSVAVAVFVLRADVVMPDGFFERIRVRYLKAMRIQTVAGTAHII